MGLGLALATAAQAATLTVPRPIRAQFKLDLFYQKFLSAGGLPVVGSSNVTDFALYEAAWIVHQMLSSRPEILTAMASNRTRLAVMAYNEYTTDIPEHAQLKSRVFWDRRARGLGATPEAPAVSCAEENLLNYPRDPYSTENICIHEFAHAIHEMGMNAIDPTFDRRLKAARHNATNSSLWKGTYAFTDPQEYWAEGAQSWFDNNRENDALHNHVNTRAELKEYDPALAGLCREVFGDGPWRYHKPMDRPPGERAHLAGFDPALSPTFRWRSEPVPDFGGKRNPDGQGFAAFGRVTKGMDVVRRIQHAPAEGQTLKPPVRIQRAVRLN